MGKQHHHEVVVSNIGTVYCGPSHSTARSDFNEYVLQSKSGKGRAAGEDVTWIKDGFGYKEHFGTACNKSPESKASMSRKEIIDFLVSLHGSIHQHHACNQCQSEYLFKKSETLLNVIQQLRSEEREN